MTTSEGLNITELIEHEDRIVTISDFCSPQSPFTSKNKLQVVFAGGCFLVAMGAIAMFSKYMCSTQQKLEPLKQDKNTGLKLQQEE